jgi:1,4-dihydroxy-2-naphthoyl-CoA hydrolase
MGYERLIHFGDTDAAGVVYFAKVLVICHEAYEAAIAQAGINLREFFNSSSPIAMPIVSAQVDFFQPMYCGDRLLINLLPEILSSSTFKIDYQIFSREDQTKLIAKASTKHTCIDSKLRSLQPFPPEIEDWLKNVKATT